MTPMDARQYRLGALFVALAAVAWSMSGLFLRAITTDLMTIVFLRGIFSGLAIFAFFLYLERGRAWTILRGLGWSTVWAAVFSAAGMMAGLGAMYYTTIAEAMVIYATLPFVTAGVAWLAIREVPSRATLIAAAVALSGVLVMLVGAGGGGSMLGKGLAVVMTLTVAVLAALMRKYRNLQMLPAMMFSAWLCSLCTVWFASPFSVSGEDWRLIVTFALAQNAMGLVLYTLGSRWIPASDASLLTALEVPLTPLWVWIFMNEVPNGPTLAGGLIVLAALFGHIHAEMRRNRVSEPAVMA